jgi:sugar phosphate isomerase/epimerase
MDFTRREMLRFGLSSAALWAAGAQALSAAEKKKIPIALQLYSVRQACTKDLPGVLQEVARIGYQGVEFAGYYGRKADQLRTLLKDNGLKCCGTHTGLDTLLGDAFPRTVEFNKTIGNPYLIVPGLPRARVDTAEHIADTGKLFKELAAKAKECDMFVGYHAHGGDFRKFNGETEWDILFTNAGPSVVMQMDVGNCLEGGGDPYAILKKYPGQSLTVHLKEHGGKKGAVIGEGTVKWDEIFRLCETIGGTKWYIVEQESYTSQATPLESVRRCMENLRKMGKA